MNLVFGSVIYPNAVKYAADFIESLNTQTYRKFSLILINDGVADKELNEILEKCSVKYEIIAYSYKLSPAELRIKLFEEALHRNNDYLILGDIDDFFSKDRVERIVKGFTKDKDIGFLYNDFLLADGKKCMPKFPLYVNTINEILDYNFLGLSNTAVNMKYIDESFINSLSECKSQVFDWYLFSRLILNGQKGSFIPNAFTYYRLHENNYAGIPHMTKEMIDKEVFVKRLHYKMLARYDSCFVELSKVYDNDKYETNERCSYFWWNLTRRNQK